MKITLSKNRLSQALNYTSRATSNKPNIPVLSNILFEVGKNDLRLSATNLDMGINMWIGGQVEEEGKTTVSGKFVTDFINATQDGKIKVSLKKDVLKVEAENSKADFNTIAASEFPILPKASGEPFFTIKVEDFVDAMEKVLFSCSTDVITSQLQYTGVLFELSEEKKDQLTLVGLDGYRLSRKVTKIERTSEDAQQLIIPARSLQELVKVVTSEEVEELAVYLSGSKTQIIFKFNDIELSIRLLEGPYPDYRPVIPTQAVYSFEVDKKSLEQAMKVVNTFARSVQGRRAELDIDIETSTLFMRSQIVDLGKNETKLPIQDVQGSNDFKGAYNLQYLIDMLNHFPGEKVKFETSGPLAPAVFTESSDPDFVHLIMAMQRND